MIVVERHEAIAELRFAHAKDLNPFSVAMTRQLIELSASLEADEAVAGVLLWGGEGRAFSVGGDFQDLRAIEGQAAFAQYLRDIVQSYQALLRLSKPVVAAIDRFAIGQGLQVALMADWRVATERSVCQMPELANGMPCPLGSVILEALLGRAAMMHLVVGCAKLDAAAAHRLLLVDERCAPDGVKAAGLARLETLCRYPQVPFRSTKRIHNARLIDALERVREPAAQAHVESFFGGNAQAHFTRILGPAP